MGFACGLVHAGAGLLGRVCAGSELAGIERQERSLTTLREGLGLFHLPAASKLLSLSSTQLHYLRLPKDISEDHVILMDCTVSTGAAAMMAVRVLLVGMARAGAWPGATCRAPATAMLRGCAWNWLLCRKECVLIHSTGWGNSP